jgi:hypothetical protein
LHGAIATLESFEVHVAKSVTFCVPPPSKSAVAVKVSTVPECRLAELGATETERTGTPLIVTTVLPLTAGPAAGV